jgi:hypothetical protein
MRAGWPASTSTPGVVGGDPLTVEVQLLDGQQESYGKPALITVSSTAYARAAAWVVAVAFIAILVFVVFGVTRAHSQGAGGAPARRSGTVVP